MPKRISFDGAEVFFGPSGKGLQKLGTATSITVDAKDLDLTVMSAVESIIKTSVSKSMQALIDESFVNGAVVEPKMHKVHYVDATAASVQTQKKRQCKKCGEWYSSLEKNHPGCKGCTDPKTWPKNPDEQTKSKENGPVGLVADVLKKQCGGCGEVYGFGTPHSCNPKAAWVCKFCQESVPKKKSHVCHSKAGKSLEYVLCTKCKDQVAMGEKHQCGGNEYALDQSGIFHLVEESADLKKEVAKLRSEIAMMRKANDEQTLYMKEMCSLMSQLKAVWEKP